MRPLGTLSVSVHITLLSLSIASFAVSALAWAERTPRNQQPSRPFLIAPTAPSISSEVPAATDQRTNVATTVSANDLATGIDAILEESQGCIDWGLFRNTLRDRCHTIPSKIEALLRVIQDAGLNTAKLEQHVAQWSNDRGSLDRVQKELRWLANSLARLPEAVIQFAARLSEVEPVFEPQSTRALADLAPEAEKLQQQINLLLAQGERSREARLILERLIDRFRKRQRAIEESGLKKLSEAMGLLKEYGAKDGHAMANALEQYRQVGTLKTKLTNLNLMRLADAWKAIENRYSAWRQVTVGNALEEFRDSVAHLERGGRVLGLELWLMESRRHYQIKKLLKDLRLLEEGDVFLWSDVERRYETWRLRTIVGMTRTMTVPPTDEALKAWPLPLQDTPTKTATRLVTLMRDFKLLLGSLEQGLAQATSATAEDLRANLKSATALDVPTAADVDLLRDWSAMYTTSEPGSRILAVWDELREIVAWVEKTWIEMSPN